MNNIEIVELILRWAPALTMVIFGLHQMARPGAWLEYLPESLRRLSPLSPETDMRLHSLGNIVFGIFLMTGAYPLVAAWVALVWWATILPFAFRVSWTIGLRDLTITLGLVALVVALTK